MAPKSVNSFRDFLGNQVVKGDLVIVGVASRSSSVMWLGRVLDIKEHEKLNYYGPNGWQKTPVSTTYEYKAKVQGVHPGAYSGRYPHHSWDIDTNIVTGETEYVGLPRAVSIDSRNVVRYASGLAPILDDTDWNQRHVLSLHDL